MGNRRHEKLTPEEWRAMIPGMTTEELAERTGYNRQYIRRIARSVGARPLRKRRCLRGFDEEEMRKIISTSTSDAAELFGVSKQRVGQAHAAHREELFGGQ